MAEYKEVLYHLKRMCDSYKFCDDGCPLCDGTDSFRTHCMASFDMQKGIYPPVDIVERAVMEWASEHPEPKLVYPTWEEWFKRTYPKGNIYSFCPKIYDCDFACVLPVFTCKDCHKQPIPKHIAEALGVKPEEVK